MIHEWGIRPSAAAALQMTPIDIQHYIANRVNGLLLNDSFLHLGRDAMGIVSKSNLSYVTIIMSISLGTCSVQSPSLSSMHIKFLLRHRRSCAHSSIPLWANVSTASHGSGSSHDTSDSHRIPNRHPQERNSRQC